MATRLTLATSVRRLINEEDSDNSHFTADEIYDYLNQAIRFLGTDLEWPLQLAQATIVTDQPVYTLPDDFIALVDIYLDGRNLTIIDRADLSAISLTWQNHASGSPRYAYKSDNKKIGLWPPPSSEFNDLLLQIQHIKIPPNLTDDTTAPDLHLTLQDCLPFYAAFLCEHKMGNKKQAETNLGYYEMHKKKLASKVQGFSDDLKRFRWSYKGGY